jgi:hypothetical protein
MGVGRSGCAPPGTTPKQTYCSGVVISLYSAISSENAPAVRSEPQTLPLGHRPVDLCALPGRVHLPLAVLGLAAALGGLSGAIAVVGAISLVLAASARPVLARSTPMTT